MGLLRKKSEKNCSTKTKNCSGSKCSSTKNEQNASQKKSSNSKCSSTKTAKNCSSSRVKNTASKKTKACGK